LADSAPVTPAQATPVIVTLPAEIDMANDRGVLQQLGCALASGAPVVVADMSGTRFCDSMGLRALVLAHQQAAAHHAELRLVITSAEVLRVMAITQLDTVLRIYPSLDAAQATALSGEAHNLGPAASRVPSS
jgi:anti-sigma B factor antagonist